MPWTPTYPSLPGGAVALAACGAEAFAALADGAVVGSADGGRRWAPLGPAPAAGPTALAATARTLVLATCSGVFVRRRSPAAGAGWTRATGVPAGALVLALALAGSRHTARVVAGTLRHGVLASSDGGHSWQPASRGLPLDGDGLEVHALAAAGGRLVAAHAFGVHGSADAGRSWVPAGGGLPGGADRADLATDGCDVFAGVGGRLFAAAGGAATDGWHEVVGPHVYLVGGAGRALVATDAAGALVASTSGGVRWATAAAGLPARPEAVAGGARGVVAAVADAPGAAGLWHHAPFAADDAPAPEVRVELGEAAPNPLDRWADLAFSLSAPARVLLTIHDALDREVARPADGPFVAGRHAVRFTPVGLPAGLYRWRLAAGGRAQARPLVVRGDPA